MASLLARSPLRSSHPLLLVNKLISLTAFVVLLCAGWVALSYLKNEMTSRWRGNLTEATAASESSNLIATSRTDETGRIQSRPLSMPIKLVYSCSKDDLYYHTSNHLPARSERSALSVEAALQRGLKPCPVCMSR